MLNEDKGGDKALQKAIERNLERVRSADERDKEILSKYLPEDIGRFFPFRVSGPDDFRIPSDDWVNEVIAVSKEPCPVPKKSDLEHGIGEKELEHNTRYLADCDWDLEKVFQRNRGTTINHGSEFRPLSQLARIIGDHPNFEYLKEMFTEGFDYKLS